MTEHAIPSDRHRWLKAVLEQQARRERTQRLRAELAAARDAGLRRRHEARAERALRTAIRTNRGRS